MSSSVKKRRRRQEEEEEEEEEEGARVEGCESDSESSLSGEGEDDQEDDGSSSEFDPSMEVNVEFEVRPISEDNGPAIQRLLQQLLPKGSVAAYGLTQLLLAQDGIGSVIQVESDLVEGSGGDENTAEEVREGGEPRTSCDDGEDDEGEGGVCGVTSVLNLTHHRSNKAVQSLTDHLLTQCKQHSPSVHPRLSQLLAPPTKTSGSNCAHVGLVINERYLNIPPHVAPPLLKSLLSEVKEASRKGLPYDFEKYLLLARSYLVVPSPLGSPPLTKKRRKGGGGGEERGDGEETAQTPVRGVENGTTATSSPSSSCVLHNQEYEIFQEEAELTFSYPVGEDGCGGSNDDRVFGGGWGFEDDSLQQTRTVMVISASRLQSAIDKLSSLLS